MDDEDEKPPNTSYGSASSALYNEPDEDRFVPVIWIPDPETRNGWREFYTKKPPQKPSGKPFGFGRR